MILAMDIGNTCITLGIYDGEKLAATTRLATDRARTSDQYAVELHTLLQIYGLDSEKFSGAIIGSVVPALNHHMSDAIERVIHHRPLVVGSGVKTGLNILLDDPAQAGADLVCGAVGAKEKYPLPCLVFDLGTATTISVVDKNGNFLGGTIAAGIGISLDALASRTSQLPLVSLKNPGKVVGRNTVEAMRSGMIYGTASMIDGMIERIEEELGQPCTVVATGGRSGDVIPYCKRAVALDPDLLLDGLRVIYSRNTK